MSVYKNGLVLSGGGARGIAHIGVLQALEDHDIQVDAISGCSAGAIVGVLYAAGCSPSKITNYIKNKSLYGIIKMGIPSRGMMEMPYFREILEKEIPHNSFDELKTPFYLSVTNLNTGTCEVKHEGGNLIDYVIASSTIPMVFKPIKIGRDLYVDGGIVNNLPVDPLLGKCERLIGVNVNTVEYVKDVSGLTDVGIRCLDISMKEQVQSNLKLCDMAIEPKVSHFGMFSLSKPMDIFNAGYSEATSVILASRTNQISHGTSASR